MCAAYGQPTQRRRRKRGNKSDSGHVQQYISILVALWETYPSGATRSNIDAEASRVHPSIFLCLARGEGKKPDREALAERDQHIIVKVAAASDYDRVLSSVVDARSSISSVAAGKILPKRPMAPIWLFKRPS